MLRIKIKKFLREALKKVATALLVPSETKEGGVVKKEKVKAMLRRDDRETKLKHLNEKYWKKAKAIGWSRELWEERMSRLQYTSGGGS